MSELPALPNLSNVERYSVTTPVTSFFSLPHISSARPRNSPFMHIDKLLRSAVGASAKRSGARITTSRTPPIYRPPNRHQPKKSPSTSVGARVVEWGREGLYGRPRPVPCAHLWRNALTPPPPGDHKGPPHIHPATLAPTDHPASCLASRLRLMPIECLNRSSQPIPSFRQVCQ